MTDSKPFEQQFENQNPNAQIALIRKFLEKKWFGPPVGPIAEEDRVLWEVFSECWKLEGADKRPRIEDIACDVAQLSLADNRPSSQLDDIWQKFAKDARNPRPAVDYKRARGILFDRRA
jgi:hypothetical protein